MSSESTKVPKSAETSPTESTKIELTPEMLQALLQQNNDQTLAEDEIDLAELWSSLMKRKWLILVLTGLVTFSVALATLFMTPQYESSVSLMPVSGGGESGLAPKYGGLASLAGISLPSGGAMPLSAEAVSTLMSKRFLKDYILEKDLKKQLFYQSWDSENNRWLVSESLIGSFKKTLTNLFGSSENGAKFSYEGQEILAEGEPSVYSVVDFFSNNVLSISENSESGIFTLKIKWIDPVVARDWANELVLRVDNELRQKAIAESQATIAYMQDKLPTIKLQDFRAIALQMIEDNLKKVTFAQVKQEYVFKVIDPAIVAGEASSPKKGLMVAVGFVLGLMLSLFLALILNWRDNRSESSVESDKPSA
jgi:capsular polysaccharide biosynthesis protein